MSTIYLFGGTSALGNSAIQAIQARDPESYNQVIRIQRIVGGPGFGEIHWNPDTPSRVDETFDLLHFGQDDLAIVALGATSLDDVEERASELPSKVISDLIWTNLTLPYLVSIRAFEKLNAAGGGKLVIMTSAAAFPALSYNWIYGNVKRTLDGLLYRLALRSRYLDTKVFLVRSSYSQTRINENRRPTPLAIDVSKFGQRLSKKLKRPGVVWLPTVFRFVSLALTTAPFLRGLADRSAKKSRITQASI